LSTTNPTWIPSTEPVAGVLTHGTDLFNMKQINVPFISKLVFNGNYFAECTRNFSEATSTLKIKKGMFL
jgi:hypothetical protein